MKTKKWPDDSLPNPVNDRSSKAELWNELCAARGEIDTQQHEVLAAREALRANDAELVLMRAKLAGAWLRLGVIQAALAHSEAP